MRDALGERAYPPEQVVRLHLVRHLLQSGQRPRHVVPLELPALQNLLRDSAPDSVITHPGNGELQACWELLAQHDMNGLRQKLNQAALQRGLLGCVQELIGPLNALVGQAWVRGDIQIFEEHLYTECVTIFLRSALERVARDVKKSPPRVLLTTVPKEPHGLGLLMAETVFAVEACDCRSLGVQTPLADIVRAAASQGAHLVALSFSASLKPSYVLQTLQELRSQLPAEVWIWAGGSNRALSHIDLAGVVAMQRLEDMAGLLALWRRHQQVDSTADERATNAI